MAYVGEPVGLAIGSSAHAVQDEVGEEEGSQVVGGEHVVEAVRGDPGPEVLHPGVVDQHVDGAVASVDLRGDIAHLVELG